MPASEKRGRGGGGGLTLVEPGNRRIEHVVITGKLKENTDLTLQAGEAIAVFLLRPIY